MIKTTTSSLTGKRVVVTRAAEHADQLRQMLEVHGARIVLAPMIRIVPPADSTVLDAALRDLAKYDWLILTSQNAVRSIADRAAALDVNLRLQRPRAGVAAVGPATAERAAAAGLRVEYVAKVHRGSALADELAPKLRGARVLLPRSDRASAELPARLRERGAIVTDVVAYCTVDAHRRSPVDASLASGVHADAVLFFSPSAVHAFAANGEFAVSGDAVMVAIGPVTAAALREAGAARIVEAQDATPEAAIRAMEAHFASGSGAVREGKR